VKPELVKDEKTEIHYGKATKGERTNVFPENKSKPTEKKSINIVTTEKT
jgi:hypothetical protein